MFTYSVLLVVARSSKDTYENMPLILGLLSAGCNLTFIVFYILRTYFNKKKFSKSKVVLSWSLATLGIGLSFCFISFGIFAALDIQFIEPNTFINEHRNDTLINIDLNQFVEVIV